MLEMTWSQYDDALFTFNLEIDRLDLHFCELLTTTSVTSLRKYFWIDKDYISPRIVKPSLHFYPVAIKTEVMYDILIAFFGNFLLEINKKG